VESGQRDSTDRALEAASAAGQQKRTFVRAMFSDIAPRYDLLNHLLSLNIDKRWRRRAIQSLDWQRAASGVFVDLCAGTLDVSAMLARQPGFAGQVLAADFAEPMLRAGRQKVAGTTVDPAVADALSLPLRDASCDGAIVAFGVRNLADLDAGLREVARVLKPGARYVILEFSTPRIPLVRSLYALYFNVLLPRIGGMISGNRAAYRYLPASVAHFPGEAELADRMRRAGFREVRWTSLTFGIAAIHVGIR
jgi:demethylmenaquinone methyltransferase/2-methoxy-6-polyprenyl-1,4-benzoquinol methylase